MICCSKITLSSYSLAVCSSFHPAIHCLHWKLNICSKCAHEQVCGKCKTSTPLIFSTSFPFISCQTADGGREGGRASAGQPADDSTPARCLSEVFNWFSFNRPALHPQLITVRPAEPTALGERGGRQARGSDVARMRHRTQEANDILALFWWTGMLVDLLSILKDYSIPSNSEQTHTNKTVLHRTSLCRINKVRFLWCVCAYRDFIPTRVSFIDKMTCRTEQAISADPFTDPLIFSSILSFVLLPPCVISPPFRAAEYRINAEEGSNDELIIYNVLCTT